MTLTEREASTSSGGKVQRSQMDLPAMHNARRPEVAMLLYPGVTLLDLLGPQTVLAHHATPHLVWKTPICSRRIAAWS